MTTFSDIAPYHRSQPEKFAEVFFLTVLFTIALAANSTICSAMLRPYRLKIPSHVFTFSLVVANLSLALFHTPFSVASVIMDQWPFGKVWCQASGMLINWASLASNFSIVNIAIHRYYLIVRPLAVKVSIRRARLMVAFVWFSSFVTSTPPLSGWSSYNYIPGKAFCSVNWQDGGPSIFYSVYLAIVSFLLPFIILIHVYRAIYLKAKRQRKTTRYNTLQGLGGGNLRGASRNKKTTFQIMVGCLARNDSSNDVSSPPITASDREIPSSPTTSTSVFSFESSPAGNTSLPSDEELKRRQKVLKQALNRQSSVYEQKTVQNAFMLLLFFVLHITPYCIVGLWSGFAQRTPPTSLDFIVSWIFVSMTAVNPILYGFLNRPVRRTLRKSPVGNFLGQLFRCTWERSGRYDSQPQHVHAEWAQKNDGMESNC